MAEPSKNVVELKKYVKQLQTAVAEKNEENVLGLLKILKTEFEVTEAILRESKAGLAVGKLRSHQSVAVANLAKEIVKKWKTAVDKQKHASPSAAAKPALNTATSIKGKVGATPTTPTNSGPPRTAKLDGVTGNTGDKTRDRCLELIYDGLVCDSGSPVEQVFKKAAAIEAAVFKHLGSTVSADYRNKIRSLFVNLKDKNNPGLRESIVSGDIPAEKLAIMTSEDMASEEQKAATQKMKEQNLFNALAAQETEAETEAFQCGRCKQRKTRYRQAQTRSADEPMTTFVTCVNCGNRWKFS